MPDGHGASNKADALLSSHCNLRPVSNVVLVSPMEIRTRKDRSDPMFLDSVRVQIDQEIPSTVTEMSLQIPSLNIPPALINGGEEMQTEVFLAWKLLAYAVVVKIIADTALHTFLPKYAILHNSNRLLGIHVFKRRFAEPRYMARHASHNIPKGWEQIRPKLGQVMHVSQVDVPDRC